MMSMPQKYLRVWGPILVASSDKIHSGRQLGSQKSGVCTGLGVFFLHL